MLAPDASGPGGSGIAARAARAARTARALRLGGGSSAVAPLARRLNDRLRRSPAVAGAQDRTAAAWDRLVAAFCEAAEPLLLRFFPDLRLVGVLDEDGSIALHRVGRDASTALGRLDAMNPEAVASLAATRWSAVELRLPASQVLQRRLSLPAASREFLAPIIAHRLDRLTPWPAERVLYGFRTDGEAAGDGSVAVALTATSRDLVAAPLQRIRAAGLVPSAIGADADEPRRALAVDLLGGGAAPPRAASHRFVSRLALATGALLVVAVLVTALLAAGASGEREAAAHRLAKATRLLRAASSYRDLGRRERLMLADKQQDRSVLLLIEALSSSIPDDTYLRELSIQPDKVRLVGSSGNAPALIGRLEAAGLRNVRFTSTIARDRAGRDDFELSADRPPARTEDGP